MVKREFLFLFILTALFFNLGLDIKGNILHQVYYVKGVKALNNEQYPEAIGQLRKAFEIDPGSMKIKKALAVALNNYALSLGDGNKEESVELMEEAIRVLPEDTSPKQNLAVLFNEWGLALHKKGDLEGAAEKFKKAAELHPRKKTYQKNLGAVVSQQGSNYLKKGEFDSAIKAFHEAVRCMPESEHPWIMMGDCYYQLDDLGEAIDCWEEAKKLSPENRLVKNRLDKAKKEWPVQKNFDQFSSSYFRINFSPDFSRDKTDEIYNYVKEAIWDVGRDLGFYPRQKFSVFVYQSEQFKEVFGPKKHLAGLYDGKIHLHINDKTAPERIAAVVRHEYTHAVIFWITQGNCPLWLNEGLACFEEKKKEAVNFKELKIPAQQNRLIPLFKLSEACFYSADFEEASLAYREAHSVVKYLLGEYGWWTVRKILVLFGEGKTEEEVIKEALRMTPARLEEKWRSSLDDE
ncbi:MAG: tetratricopeptide repeat protein [Candidatus Ratteibacteria bacterium]|nr:tetratricopeptide repeat protein [Candidatus Ratteibacteria bacterium]